MSGRRNFAAGIRKPKQSPDGPAGATAPRANRSRIKFRSPQVQRVGLILSSSAVSQSHRVTSRCSGADSRKEVGASARIPPLSRPSASSPPGLSLLVLSLFFLRFFPFFLPPLSVGRRRGRERGRERVSDGRDNSIAVGSATSLRAGNTVATGNLGLPTENSCRSALEKQDDCGSERKRKRDGERNGGRRYSRGDREELIREERPVGERARSKVWPGWERMETEERDRARTPPL